MTFVMVQEVTDRTYAKSRFLVHWSPWGRGPCGVAGVPWPVAHRR